MKIAYGGLNFGDFLKTCCNCLYKNGIYSQASIMHKNNLLLFPSLLLSSTLTKINQSCLNEMTPFLLSMKLFQEKNWSMDIIPFGLGPLCKFVDAMCVNSA